MNLNLNVPVRVVFTQYGADIYNDSFLNIPQEYRTKKYIDGDVVTTQLWILFRVFGECMYMGNLEVPFVNNEIEVLL